MTDLVFSTNVKRLEAAFNTAKPLSREGLSVYFETLKNFSNEQFIWVVNECIKTELTFPKIATLLTYAKRWWRDGKEEVAGGKGYCFVCGKTCLNPWTEEQMQRREKA